MLMTAQLLKALWPETIHQAVWLKNRTSTHALNGKTPYEVMHKMKPDLTDLPEWGARVFVMETIAGKLDQKSTKGRWLGYSSTSKGYCIYGANKAISVKRNVTFNNAVLTVPDIILIAGEDKQESIQKTSNQNTTVQSPHTEPKPLEPSADIITCDPLVKTDSSTGTVDNLVKNLENTPSQQPLRRSERLNPPVVQPPEPELRCSEHLKPQANLLIAEDPDIKINLSMALIVSKIIDPPSAEATRKQKDWLEWETSIKAELDIHKRLGIGVLITPPLNVNIIDSRIVLCYKLNKDGFISTRKSRLVAQGFTQQEGIDYNDTFSPTAKLTTIRVIAAIAVRNNWELEQMDMDTAYLNASLKEDIYVPAQRL